MCFCCVRFSFFSTMPRDWLGRTSPRWSILCPVGCTLTQRQRVNPATNWWNFGSDLEHILDHTKYSVYQICASSHELIDVNKNGVDSNVTLTYFVLIGIIHCELGRFHWHAPATTQHQFQCGMAEVCPLLNAFALVVDSLVFALCRDNYDQYGFILTSRERCLADVKFLVHELRQQADKRQTVTSTVNFFSVFFILFLFFSLSLCFNKLLSFCRFLRLIVIVLVHKKTPLTSLVPVFKEYLGTILMRCCSCCLQWCRPMWSLVLGLWAVPLRCFYVSEGLYDVAQKDLSLNYLLQLRLWRCIVIILQFTSS